MWKFLGSVFISLIFAVSMGGLIIIDEDTWYWTFSTMFQGFAGLLGLVGIFMIYRGETIQKEIGIHR